MQDGAPLLVTVGVPDRGLRRVPDRGLRGVPPVVVVLRLVLGLLVDLHLSVGPGARMAVSLAVTVGIGPVVGSGIGGERIVGDDAGGIGSGVGHGASVAAPPVVVLVGGMGYSSGVSRNIGSLGVGLGVGRGLGHVVSGEGAGPSDGGGGGLPVIIVLVHVSVHVSDSASAGERESHGGAENLAQHLSSSVVLVSECVCLRVGRRGDDQFCASAPPRPRLK
mmetsp:Transcript_7430/g.19109  ORF Transcript_7430/g.19109 Transcript_7430/m.19109 type:complete len:221 (-) Transcript_7430:129-791(-)